ncbi:MAG: MarR family transcriptional regulator [Pseudomonadota bacterium]
MSRRTASALKPPPDDERLSLRLWLQLMKASKAIEGDIGGRFRRTHGQSLARFDVLSQLYRFGGDWVAIGALGERMMATGGNITALIDRMAAEGLVERRPSPTDRRSHQVRLTEDGLALFRAMTEDHAQWVDTVLGDVDDEEKRALIDLLVRVRRAFEKQQTDGRASNRETPE